MKQLLTFGIMGALLVLSPPAGAGDPGKIVSPKETCEVLMNAVMPFAQQMLEKHRSFFPFGATMSPQGKVAATASSTGKEQPAPKELIALLEKGFRDGAKKGQYKATALAVDIKTVPPGRKEKQDAVEIRLDHRDGYSVRVIFPYAFSAGGELKLESPFAVPGDKGIFGR
jgi:hypothetical protein